MKKRLSLTETQINQSAVSDVRAAVYETVSKLASGNVAAVKLAQLVVEAMHAPHFLLIFKISEVRHLDVSAFFGGRQKRFFVVTAKGQVPVYSV